MSEVVQGVRKDTFELAGNLPAQEPVLIKDRAGEVVIELSNVGNKYQIEFLNSTRTWCTVQVNALKCADIEFSGIKEFGEAFSKNYLAQDKFRSFLEKRLGEVILGGDQAVRTVGDNAKDNVPTSSMDTISSYKPLPLDPEKIGVGVAVRTQAFGVKTDEDGKHEIRAGSTRDKANKIAALERAEWLKGEDYSSQGENLEHPYDRRTDTGKLYQMGNIFSNESELVDIPKGRFTRFIEKFSSEGELKKLNKEKFSVAIEDLFTAISTKLFKESLFRRKEDREFITNNIKNAVDQALKLTKGELKHDFIAETIASHAIKLINDLTKELHDFSIEKRLEFLRAVVNGIKGTNLKISEGSKIFSLAKISANLFTPKLYNDLTARDLYVKELGFSDQLLRDLCGVKYVKEQYNNPSVEQGFRIVDREKKEVISIGRYKDKNGGYFVTVPSKALHGNKQEIDLNLPKGVSTIEDLANLLTNNDEYLESFITSVEDRWKSIREEHEARLKILGQVGIWKKDKDGKLVRVETDTHTISHVNKEGKVISIVDGQGQEEDPYAGFSKEELVLYCTLMKPGYNSQFKFTSQEWQDIFELASTSDENFNKVFEELYGYVDGKVKVGNVLLRNDMFFQEVEKNGRKINWSAIGKEKTDNFSINYQAFKEGKSNTTIVPQASTDNPLELQENFIFIGDGLSIDQVVNDQGEISKNKFVFKYNENKEEHFVKFGQAVEDYSAFINSLQNNKVVRKAIFDEIIKNIQKMKK